MYPAADGQGDGFASVPTIGQGPRSGTFANGMEFLTWGSGPKTLLYIQGGPGSAATKKGMGLRMIRRQLYPFVKAGFAVWVVTRRKHMPPGHTVADMADDYAQVITEEFGGRIDLVFGLSTGGLIAQYLAALHPDSVRHVAIVVAAAEDSDWAKDVDARIPDCSSSGTRGKVI
jgi:pimeloyl-ACP methyl ester carboxylesterase